MKIIYSLSIIFLLLVSLLKPNPGWATDQQDLSIALKTLPLLTDKITGSVNVAIIYDPVSAETKADAEAIKAFLDNGLEAPGNIKLTAELMDTNELSHLAGAKLAFFAHGLPAADYGAINAAASSAGVLTICTDIDCVKANKCILGIVSKPRVEIYYSSIAADAAHISFAPAFTMLVKQI